MYVPNKRLLKIFFVVVLLMGGMLIGNGLSQELYPNRPVTMVVPWGTGGTSDTVTRVFAKIAEKELGQPIIVENKPGAGGSIGVNYVLKSKPDGYTLGVPQTSSYIIHPYMKKLPYDPLTQVIDIATIANHLLGLAVRPDAPWNTFEDIISYARSNPGKFRYACAGIGTTQHICMERIAMKEGIKWTAVPFKSGAEATVAFLGGHTDGVVQTTVELLPHTGKFRLLLSESDVRWPDFPNVPTVLEKGYNFWAMAIQAINAPKGVPESIIRKLESVFDKTKKDPSYIQAMDKIRMRIPSLSGKEYTELWKKEYDEMGKVIKILGLREE